MKDIRCEKCGLRYVFPDTTSWGNAQAEFDHNHTCPPTDVEFKLRQQLTSVRVKVDGEGVTEHVYINGFEIPGAFFECDFRTGLVTLLFRAKISVES